MLAILQTNEFRWKEIDTLEAALRKFNASFNFANAPVECATLFHERCQLFLKQYLFDVPGSAQVLGKVTDYLVRYEIQVSDV